MNCYTRRIKNKNKKVTITPRSQTNRNVVGDRWYNGKLEVIRQVLQRGAIQRLVNKNG